MKSVFKTFILILTAHLAYAQDSYSSQPIEIPSGSPLLKELKVEQVHHEPVQTQIEAPGVIEANPKKVVHIYPPATGKLHGLDVQLGDQVTKGQTVAELNSPDFTIAQDNYLKAKSNLVLNDKALIREQRLYAAHIPALADLEQAQANDEQAKSDFAAATDILRSYGFDPAKDTFGHPYHLTSPMTGRVIELLTGAPGEFKTDATQPMMTIADLSEVWLTASIAEKDLSFLTPNQSIEATCIAYPGERIRGVLERIGDTLDPDARTVKIRALLKNPDNRFKPGMYATVYIKRSPVTQITVPTNAVVQIGFTPVVFEQVNPSEFITRQVQTGDQMGNRIIILRGLTPQSRVVVENATLLTNQ
jgi:membrane fusion protein, heavy metal efflux system